MLKEWYLTCLFVCVWAGHGQHWWLRGVCVGGVVSICTKVA